jgi:hypothetical protein
MACDSNCDALVPGTTFKLIFGPVPAPAGNDVGSVPGVFPDDEEYVVQENDNCYDIAKKTGASLPSLRDR